MTEERATSGLLGLGTLLVLACVLCACGARARTATPTAAPTAPPVATRPSATSTATAALLPSATVTVPASPIPTAQPTPSPLPGEVTDLVSPLLVDSARGRLYLRGLVDGRPQALALAAGDGHLLAAYGITGTMALDGAHGWLYVDQGEAGLAVLDAATGALKVHIALPAQEPWAEPPPPLADPSSGRALAFRGNSVYWVDALQGKITDSFATDVRSAPGSCGTYAGPLPIQAAALDAITHTLYLEYLTYVCTPWFSHSVVSYDLITWQEVGRREGAGGSARFLAADGFLYGSSWDRMGSGSRWAMHALQAVASSSEWRDGYARLCLDTKRQRLYESAGRMLRVLGAQSMELQMAVPAPVQGLLVGCDPATDQLYFLDEGRLLRSPGSAVQPAQPQSLVASAPPTTSLRSLIMAPDGEGTTWFGLWESEQQDMQCWAFNQNRGRLLLSTDAGRTWGQPVGGLADACGYVTTFAVSPDYAQDHTMLAGLPGLGVWRSTDGGRLWQPSSRGLTSMGVKQIILPAGFAQHRTAFAQTLPFDEWFRSPDGGRTWAPLQVKLTLIVPSPEFETDGTLLGMYISFEDDPNAPQNELLVSDDRGSIWRHAGELGAARRAEVLSLAPAFAKWHGVFLQAENGVLYRSENGGVQWSPVLSAAPPVGDAYRSSPRLLYAGSEERRVLFFLDSSGDVSKNPPRPLGTIYRSNNGGLTWQTVELPAGVVPTALWLSPDFERDGLLYVGTADGRVVTVKQGG